MHDTGTQVSAYMHMFSLLCPLSHEEFASIDFVGGVGD